MGVIVEDCYKVPDNMKRIPIIIDFISGRFICCKIIYEFLEKLASTSEASKADTEAQAWRLWPAQL